MVWAVNISISNTGGNTNQQNVEPPCVSEENNYTWNRTSQQSESNY